MNLLRNRSILRTITTIKNKKLNLGSLAVRSRSADRLSCERRRIRMRERGGRRQDRGRRRMVCFGRRIMDFLLEGGSSRNSLPSSVRHFPFESPPAMGKETKENQGSPPAEAGKDGSFFFFFFVWFLFVSWENR